MFYCRIITHRYTDFRSYLDFHKMWDVPGFRSVGHKCAASANHPATQPHTAYPNDAVLCFFLTQWSPPSGVCQTPYVHVATVTTRENLEMF